MGGQEDVEQNQSAVAWGTPVIARLKKKSEPHELSHTRALVELENTRSGNAMQQSKSPLTQQPSSAAV